MSRCDLLIFLGLIVWLPVTQQPWRIRLNPQLCHNKTQQGANRVHKYWGVLPIHMDLDGVCIFFLMQRITIKMTWASLCLKSPTTRLLVKQFVQSHIKGNTIALHYIITGLCEGKPLVTGRFHAQRSSDAEIVSISLRHHDRANACIHVRKKCPSCNESHD